MNDCFFEFPISSSCIFCENNEIWFTHSQMPLLMHANLDKKVVDFIKLIPYEKYAGIFLFRGIFVTDEEVILIPGTSNKIVIYSKKNDDFKFIYIKSEYTDMFRGYIQEGEWLYFKPSSYSKIVRLNYITKEIQYGINWKIFVGNNCNIDGACKYKNEIIYSLYRTNSLLKYDICNNKLCKVEINNLKEINQLVVWNDYIYTYNMADKFLYKLNANTMNIVQKVKLDFKAIWMNIFNNCIYLSPIDKPIWMILNLDLKCIYKAECKNSWEWGGSQYNCFEWSCGKNGQIVAIDSRNNLIKVIDDKICISELKIDIDLEYTLKLIMDKYMTEPIMEGFNCHLSDLIKKVLVNC